MGMGEAMRQTCGSLQMTMARYKKRLLGLATRERLIHSGGQIGPRMSRTTVFITKAPYYAYVANICIATVDRQAPLKLMWPWRR